MSAPEQGQTTTVPGEGQPGVVAPGLELRDRPVQQVVDGRLVDRRIDLELQEGPEDPRAPRERDVRTGLGLRQGLVEEVGRARHRARVGQGIGQVGQHPGSRGRTGRQELRGPLQQVGRGRQVAPRDRPRPRRGQAGRCPFAQLPGPGVEGPELDPVPVGLLQVVAEDLLELRHGLTRHAFQPLGEALVQVGALSLRH